jgi:hypothetical protein
MGRGQFQRNITRREPKGGAYATTLIASQCGVRHPLGRHRRASLSPPHPDQTQSNPAHPVQSFCPIAGPAYPRRVPPASQLLKCQI